MKKKLVCEREEKGKREREEREMKGKRRKERGKRKREGRRKRMGINREGRSGERWPEEGSKDNKDKVILQKGRRKAGEGKAGG